MKKKFNTKKNKINYLKTKIKKKLTDQENEFKGTVIEKNI